MSFEKQIVLENITFQYPNTTSKALDEISLTIKKGQSIGIIGKSGSGKTTLVDGFWGYLSHNLEGASHFLLLFCRIMYQEPLVRQFSDRGYFYLS